MTSPKLDQLCINAIRFLAVDTVQQANSGHPGTPMGAAAMAYVLWDRFLKHNPGDPTWPDRDRFILSPGHASAFGYGPRFLHSTGQLHKGGPGSGLFLQLTAKHVQDVAIPEAPYSFGVLADGQAVGDLRALRSSERRAVRVDLGSDPEAGIRGMADEVG